jgi:hypothetical protein
MADKHEKGNLKVDLNFLRVQNAGMKFEQSKTKGDSAMKQTGTVVKMMSSCCCRMMFCRAYHYGRMHSAFLNASK